MKRGYFAATFAVAALAVSASAHAEPAGRVLAAAGAVTVVRAGQSMPLAQGAPIENGDSIRVGDKSTVQIGFTDESIVSLRPNSEFRVEDYRFSRNVESDRSIFGLIKGGFRTITGLIGKGNQKNYEVRGSTATIGIRGTHFVLRQCDGDCALPDGTKGPDGLFGGVTDGRISVTNGAGTTEFGQQQFFHVMGRDVPVRELLGPPSVLAEDARSARGRGGARGPAVANAGGTGEGGTSGSSETSNSPQQTDLSGLTIAAPGTVQTYSVNALPALAGGSGTISATQASGAAYPSSIYTNVEEFLISASELASIGFAGVTSASSLADAYKAAGYSVGYSSAAGAYWVYEPADASDGPGHFGWHTAWGDEPTNLPTTGIAQYNFVGGTNPTDNFGRVGSFSSGNMTVNFGAQTISNNSAMTMSFGSGGGQTPTTYQFAANQTWALGVGAQAASVSCTVGCMGSSYGWVNGRFVGSGGTGFVASVAVSNTMLNATYQSHAAGAVAVFAKQ